MSEERFTGRSCRAHLVDDWYDDLVEDGGLVCGGREDLVELICLVAERTGAHRKIDGVSFDAVGGDDDTAVLAQFAVISPTTADDDVDVGL